MAMLRYNAGKNPLSLIPTSFFEAIFNHAFEASQPLPTKLIERVGEVLDFGARKYAAHNWRKGGSWSAVMNSALRHITRMINAHTLDVESGLSEAGHLGCNIAFLLEFATQGIGDDDRFVTKEAPEGFDIDHEPNLLWVLGELLSFRDGGSILHLKHAAWELARWVEAQPDPNAPAGITATNPNLGLPFSFPISNLH